MRFMKQSMHFFSTRTLFHLNHRRYRYNSDSNSNSSTSTYSNNISTRREQIQVKSLEALEKRTPATSDNDGRAAEGKRSNFIFSRPFTRSTFMYKTIRSVGIWCRI